MDKNLQRDVFLNLLSTIALAIASVSFGTLIFQLINVYLPDVLGNDYAPSFYDGIRWSIAALIVVFPVYLWTMNFLKKDLDINPLKSELKIRKWLLYLTLFITAIVIVVDLITLIYNFLQGELTVRFLLKVVTVLIIAGSIFLYYLKVVREGVGAVKSWVSSILPKGIIVLVAGFVIWGLVVAGLPKNQRLVRLDERRVNDLSMLEAQVNEYWRRNEKLPDSLKDLENQNIVVPVDPLTKVVYEYKKLGDLKFELCANFQTSSLDQNESQRPKPASQFYANLQKHDMGRQCFERIIDPKEFQLTQPLKI